MKVSHESDTDLFFKRQRRGRVYEELMSLVLHLHKILGHFLMLISSLCLEIKIFLLTLTFYRNK
jgi:hypothetical protein